MAATVRDDPELKSAASKTAKTIAIHHQKLLSCCGSIPRPSHEFTMLARHHQHESGQQHTATDCIQPPGHNGSRYLKTLMAFLSLFLCQRNGRDASIDLELIHQTLAFDVLRLSESLGAR